MWSAAHLDRGTEGPDRAKLPQDLWIEILTFCTRDWFAPLAEEEEEEARRRPPTRMYCEWCQLTLRDVPGRLRPCVRCKLVWYCSEECNVAGWRSKANPHKAVCDAEQARLKSLKGVAKAKMT